MLLACSSEGVVRGVLIDVQSSGVTRVDAVTLRADDGTDRRFVVGQTRSAHPLSSGHLRQHMTNGDRIVVRFRSEGGELVATEISDDSN